MATRFAPRGVMIDGGRVYRGTFGKRVSLGPLAGLTLSWVTRHIIAGSAPR